MRRLVVALLLAISMFLIAPGAFAQVALADKGLVTFGGGVVNGVADFPGKHTFFGGGGYVYPFNLHNSGNVIARRLAVGFELGRTVLGNSEEFDTEYGPGRFQSQSWFLSPQARFDLLQWKRFRAVIFGGYTGIRERTVLQIVDPYQYGKHWVTASSGGQWDGTTNGGLSVAFVLPRKKYSGETIAGSWAFPVRYTYYSNGLKTFTVGIERYF